MKKVFVYVETGRGYGRDLLKGIYNFNNDHLNWEIIFEPAYYLKTQAASDFTKMIRMHRPDGCIIENLERVHEIETLGIPIFQASGMEYLNNFPCLKTDYEADGKIAIDYFVSLGFKNLAYFGVKGIEWSECRQDRFRSLALEKNINYKSHTINGNAVSGLQYDMNGMTQWLISLPKPVGILACNDDLGLMLIHACSIGGLKVPQEVAILGIDNDELLCNIVSPKLSSIKRNITNAAYDACQLLNKLMNGDVVHDTHVSAKPVEVVVRNSTDTIASDDPQIIKAIQFIRNNENTSITVDDVVNATDFSRRTLYDRFKQTTGNSIYDEIQNSKVRRFKELLKNRSITIKEAGYHLGFSDVSHVSRWFAAIEGITPVKWRNQNL